MGWKRCQNRKHRLIKLYNNTKNSYGSGVYYDEDKKRYIRYSFSKSSKLPKFLKKVSNKKLRHSKDTLNKGKYKKYFDYWWSLF